MNFSGKNCFEIRARLWNELNSYVEVKQMRTHYDVLNLGKNCSEKEIKESFIKLSKKYHPDKNKDSDAHRRFVEVNEAYSVLGKPTTRCSYDATLSIPQTKRVHCSTGFNTRTQYERTDMYATNINRTRTGNYYSKRRLGAFLFCCMLMVLGSGLQLMAESHRRAVRSQEIAKFLRDTKNKYSAVGTRKMLLEIEEAAKKKELKRVKKEP